MTTTLKHNGVIKTYENWNKSLDEYLQIGDGVDDEMYYYFLDVLPPATATNNLVQIGEPYSHVDGYPTYSTLKKIDGVWVYAGRCFEGKSENVD